MEPDLTVYYYTYSTICQTLAGAFGFLVAVVLYRMQAADAGLAAKGVEFENYYSSDRGQLLRLRRRGKWDEFVEHLAEMIEDTRTRKGGVPPQVQSDFDDLKSDVEKLVLVKRLFLIALRLTVGTIGASLVLLGLTPLVAGSYPVFAGVILGLAVFFAIITILSYAALVRAVLFLHGVGETRIRIVEDGVPE